MVDVSAINRFLQGELARRSLSEVAAVEAASWLEEEGLLKDSTQRAGKPLRDLLRAGVISGQRQMANRRWFIDLERSRRYWILCSKPETSKIELAITELEVATWTSKGSDLRPGDRCAIWRYKGRTEKRGIVALGEVLSPPEVRTDSHPEYWANRFASDRRNESVPACDTDRSCSEHYQRLNCSLQQGLTSHGYEWFWEVLNMISQAIAASTRQNYTDHLPGSLPHSRLARPIAKSAIERGSVAHAFK